LVGVNHRQTTTLKPHDLQAERTLCRMRELMMVINIHRQFQQFGPGNLPSIAFG
jgi:hypothetical protein